jgi:hypothetical protein
MYNCHLTTCRNTTVNRCSGQSVTFSITQLTRPFLQSLLHNICIFNFKNLEMTVLCDIAPCNLVESDLRFRAVHSLSLQGNALMMEAVSTSETSISTSNYIREKSSYSPLWEPWISSLQASLQTNAWMHSNHLKPVHCTLTCIRRNFSTAGHGCLLGCSTTSLPTFQRSVLPPSSWVSESLIALMEAVQTSEMWVNSYQSTQSYSPEDSHFHNIAMRTSSHSQQFLSNIQTFHRNQSLNQSIQISLNEI